MNTELHFIHMLNLYTRHLLERVAYFYTDFIASSHSTFNDVISPRQVTKIVFPAY